MLTVRAGNLFESGAQTLVNPVNCVGVMGKGVALEFKKRFPENFQDYARRCRAKQLRLGEPYLFRDPSARGIVNFPTKDHWRSSSRLVDIEKGLDHLVRNIDEWGLRSIALPALGCGNGGLAWSEVELLIQRKMHALPIEIELFAPFEAVPALR